MDERSIPPLGMTGDEFRQAASGTISDIEKYYANLPSRKVVPSISPGYLQNLIPSEPPKTGETWSEITRDMESKILPGVTHWQSPKFMAFFCANSTYPSILGEMWSAALTAPAFNWICSPVVTELETIVLDWLAQTLALPQAFHSQNGRGGGVIQGSASEAIVTCMVAARERYIRRQLTRLNLTSEEDIEDASCSLRSKLVALGSDQAHSSTQKAAIIAGTRYRSIPCTRATNYSLTGLALRSKIEELEAKGLEPYYLTVSLGTTGTCAVDDFASIAAVAKDYPDLWIHCDAAYAGAALVLPEHQHLSKQLEFLDSFDMNMHKWLLVNFDASCLFVKERRDLTDTLSITPSYLKNSATDSGLVTDYRDWQIPLGRRFRALKVWFVMRTWGTQGMREHISHHLKLGRLFEGLVKERSDLFEFLCPPAFALSVITVKPPGARKVAAVNGGINGADPRPDQDSHVAVTPQVNSAALEEANDLTKKVYTLIDERKEFFLTSSVIGGVYAIRVVSANPLAEEKYVRRVFEVLAETTEEVLGRK